MNTEELIEIAEDVADDCIESCCGMYYQFHRDTLQQFAQRIEQPLQHKINELTLDVAHQQRQIDELEKDCDIIATNYDAARRASLYTADVADQALADLKAAEKKIEQLREALEDVLWDQTHENLEKARKVLEETK